MSRSCWSQSLSDERPESIDAALILDQLKATLVSCFDYDCDHDKNMQTAQCRCVTCGGSTIVVWRDVLAHILNGTQASVQSMTKAQERVLGTISS